MFDRAHSTRVMWQQCHDMWRTPGWHSLLWDVQSWSVSTSSSWAGVQAQLSTLLPNMWWKSSFLPQCADLVWQCWYPKMFQDIPGWGHQDICLFIEITLCCLQGYVLLPLLTFSSNIKGKFSAAYIWLPRSLCLCVLLIVTTWISSGLWWSCQQAIPGTSRGCAAELQGKRTIWEGQGQCSCY